MTELVTYLAQSLVDHPEAVTVKAASGTESLVLELTVAPDDMGKIIGKQGRIAKAIRTIVRAANPRDEKPVYVEIV